MRFGGPPGSRVSGAAAGYCCPGSLGGFGTWLYGLRDPRRFAALVPIAGGYIQGSTAVPTDICALRRRPIWVFHGGDDTTVYPYQSEVLVRALRRCGSRVVRFTLYPGVDHMGSWPRAYTDPAPVDVAVRTATPLTLGLGEWHAIMSLSCLFDQA